MLLKTDLLLGLTPSLDRELKMEEGWERCGNELKRERGRSKEGYVVGGGGWWNRFPERFTVRVSSSVRTSSVSSSCIWLTLTTIKMPFVKEALWDCAAGMCASGTAAP